MCAMTAEGFVNLGFVRRGAIKFVPAPHDEFDWDSITTEDIEIVVRLTCTDYDPDAVRILFCIPAGFPLWYITPRRALPPGPVRLALPWGHSAYTTIQTQRWMPGDPLPDMDGAWVMGPPRHTGLTPSSEGPRCARAFGRAFGAQLVARVLDGLRNIP